MGRHFWTKHADDEPQSKQPGGVWGKLVHALDVHLWHSNVRKMIHHSKTGDNTHPMCDRRSPETKNYTPNADTIEKLLDEKKSPRRGAKRSRANRRRSLRARIKALIAEEISRKPKGFRSNLQRTYSIHHLEALDDELASISTDWNQPIIFFPGNLEDSKVQSLENSEQSGSCDHKEETDVLDIFKVDKELLAKHLQDADENIVNFTRSALGLSKAKLSKSRSFPLPDQRRKLKPVKLENKHKEVWSFPRGETFQTLDQTRAHRSDGTDCSLATSGELAGDNEVKSGLIGEKHIYRRSSSLNESLDKYARLLESNLGTDAKLRPSKSLKLTNGCGHYAPACFRRMQSLSNSVSCYSNLNFEVLGEDPSENGSNLVAKDSGSDECNTKEDEELDRLVSDKENFPLDETKMTMCQKDETDKIKTNYSEMSYRELLDELCILDSGVHLQEMRSLSVDLRNSEGPEQRSSYFDGQNPSGYSDDLISLNATPNLENKEKSDKIVKCCPKKKYSDSYYVKHLLDQSGITMDAYERLWHSSDQPLSPQLFEQVEASWPHDLGQLNGWPDFDGCWHHQMLFDLVNEALVDVYDRSLTYYPKALSSSCKVRPFPMGSQIIDDVRTSIGKLLDLKPEEKQSLDCMVAHDLARDHSWMNLQLESECTGLDIEDIIFEELLEEVIVGL